MVILNGRSLRTSRCERGLVDFPFSRTQHCSLFSESWFFSPLYFALLGSCAVHRGEGGLGGEWNRLQQGGSQAWVSEPQSSSARALTPGGSCRHPLSPSSFPPSCMERPVLARPTWDRAGGAGAPQAVTSPSPPSPCLCPLSLRCLCSSVCDSPPLLFKAAHFIHHRQQFIFPGESFAWFH